jgi:hypothetical protein
VFASFVRPVRLGNICIVALNATLAIPTGWVSSSDGRNSVTLGLLPPGAMLKYRVPVNVAGSTVAQRPMVAVPAPAGSVTPIPGWMTGWLVRMTPRSRYALAKPNSPRTLSASWAEAAAGWSRPASGRARSAQAKSARSCVRRRAITVSSRSEGSRRYYRCWVGES